ncbi:flagellar filament capping protein FliD [Paraglaciecola aquimarina]|uniref:Flagellar hook-associated protein 2 n=1 Tax=Paraglaciecola aquimarina TaxID=1235557 RepID=A0ABU3T0D1_9ALTE|nr:flagellar filament capping protein FliD [Paraglaciecola aquimarina]MDU0355726.1 flagellar filament capping protein FliD [Paraglaciecola aquimarina]
MSIQSLGVGSGLDLESLVSQLLEAERAPKTARLDAQDEAVEAEISGLGQLKSKLEDFEKTLDDLRTEANLKGREPTIDNPTEGIEPFTAEASNSAVEADYLISVSQLASGSRIQTADAIDGGFSSTADSILSSGTGSLTFKAPKESGGGSDSFSINITDTMSLQDLSSAINANSSNFGVTSSIVSTGTADGGVKLIFTSDRTGAGNDLVIVNDSDIAELDRLSTVRSDEVTTAADSLTPTVPAQNAKATIDGIAVESKTNEFENVIENVEFNVTELSELEADGVTFRTSKLSIGFDSEGVESTIRDFVDNYNKLNAEIQRLTKYGESDLEEDGAFAGDSMIRGIQSGLNSIMFSAVNSSELGGLFQLGIEFNDDGELEIGSQDKFGFGSGEDRLRDALSDNFDEIANLFTDETEGVANRLYEFVDQYTSYSGLLKVRENAAEDTKEQILTDREQLELRMISTEDILRSKYLNLDLTVSKLNSTGSALLASLGS